MSCRHEAGDPSCSSSPEGMERAAASHRAAVKKKRDALTPDAAKFEILDFKRVPSHSLKVDSFVIMKVKYPNCKLCAYQGTKIMVFNNMTEMELIRLCRIDPHFRPVEEDVSGEARSPIARFPGSTKGWQRACSFAEMLGADGG
jgi:hypothetical protein